MAETRLARVSANTDRFDPAEAIRRYPWLSLKNQNCILSTDSDGLLCGLLMSHVLGWKIRGYYDTKALVHDAAVNPGSCVFLDVEIFRKGVRSLGQHMLLFNKRRMPANWDQFDDAFAINNFRGYDVETDFGFKYPLGAIHFLTVMMHHIVPIRFSDESLDALLFADGSLQNSFGYTENVDDWLRYLGVDDESNPLHSLFMHRNHSIRSLMRRMMKFWEARDACSIKVGSRTERGDRITLTSRGGDGSIINVQANGELLDFNRDAKARVEQFLGLLSKSTGWLYKPNDWSWNGWKAELFEKNQLSTDAGNPRLNNRNFEELLTKHPLSWAITAGNRLEYTLAAQGLPGWKDAAGNPI